MVFCFHHGTSNGDDLTSSVDFGRSKLDNCDVRIAWKRLPWGWISLQSCESWQVFMVGPKGLAAEETQPQQWLVYNDMKHTSTLNVHIMCTCFGIHFANWIRHWQVAHLGDLLVWSNRKIWWLCRNCKPWQVFITKESHQFLWDSWNTLDIKMRHLHYDSSKSPPSERLSLCWSPHYCLKTPDWSCSRKSQCPPNISGYIKSLQWKMDKHASFVDYELV